jgi:hypothetical protein
LFFRDLRKGRLRYENEVNKNQPKFKNLDSGKKFLPYFLVPIQNNRFKGPKLKWLNSINSDFEITRR